MNKTEWNEQVAERDRVAEYKRRALAPLISQRNELAPKRTALHTQLTDVQEILAEEVAIVATLPKPNNPRDQQHEAWPHIISVLAIQGTYDVREEPLPTRFPLFEKLAARGYTGRPGEAWNIASGVYGCARAFLLERRLAELDAQIAELDERIARLQA